MLTSVDKLKLKLTSTSFHILKWSTAFYLTDQQVCYTVCAAVQEQFYFLTWNMTEKYC